MVALWSPEFACVFQKGTTSRESFDATKSRDFLKKERLCRLPVSEMHLVRSVDLHPRWPHLCEGTRGGGGEWLVGLSTGDKVVEFEGVTFPMALAASRAAHQPGQAMGHVLAGLVGWGVNQPTGGFHQWGIPQGFWWKIHENFGGTPILGHLHMVNLKKTCFGENPMTVFNQGNDQMSVNTCFFLMRIHQNSNFDVKHDDKSCQI